MMFGTGEEFEYFQYPSCDCLQISVIPVDPAQYYPSTYYSFAVKPTPSSTTAMQRWLHKQRCRNAIFGRGYRLNALLRSFVPLPEAIHRRSGGLGTGEVLKKARIGGFGSRFLDVGCGAFSPWLQDLSELGFNHLVGVDPYIEKDQRHGKIRVYKRQLSEIGGEFDLISFNHSLEHVADQAQALTDARARLAPGGTLLIRVPLVSSLVWERYGVNWVELDAPRHFYLHSIQSLTGLARSHGLELAELVHDSVPFEFYGSEQYVRGIPLTDERSLWVNESSDLFTETEKAEFQALAQQVNREGRGGRASFYFRAAS
jgi:SAM-dependent methyltransferase